MSSTELQQLAADIEAGRSPTVWFTDAAVGIDQGRSGKLIEIADPTEPDHLRVKPAGSSDTLAFSPTELTLTKPARRRTTHQRHHTSAETASLFDL
ncbi:hypothetical protein ACQP2U_43425 (plasmid) [Nocardia sp. CA-084685]|uniref:hypothetical protein n=1 Tax=Nocardia sp. CA-084685 TaxID=3239970 RepID=UPI003D9541A9